uniref:hypothetical protein n=1 Tax=Phenylobacterium sp. TaxID=1871053 RepID=UPI0039830DBB
EARRNNALLTEARLSTYVGDSARALQLAEELRRSKVLGYQAGRFVVFTPIIGGRAGLHELSAARRELADVGDHLVGRVALAARIALVAEDWPQVLELGPRVLEESRDAAINTRLRCSYSALALVKLDRLPEAEAVLTETPLDSEPCVRVRAVAAEAAGDRRLADHWFGEAVRMAPSAPHAAAEWGRAKLARGDRLGAAALFAQAHRISPRYADATVWWGEALLAEDDATGAVDKFAQAAKLAPRWGRLHLKWGEALAKLGKVEEARAKWRAAATMDLTLAERAELQALTQKRTT